MTDRKPLRNESEYGETASRVISPTYSDVANFALTDARVGETEAEKAAKADMLGTVYLDLMKRAQEPSDPYREDEDCRAEASYFSEALTGYKDAYGTLWRKGGFKTGAEYLAHMKEFFLKSPEDNKTQALRDFEALDEKGQEEAALAARKWTLENAGHVAGNAFGYAMDLVRPNTTHRAGKLEVAAANFDMNDAAYRRKIRADHYADLMADNAWIEISAILPRLSQDGRACTKALMNSPDNALPESMYAKFNNLPDDEKQMIVRARTVLKPRVEGSFLNTIGDTVVGLANITSSIATAPYRLGNKLSMIANDDIFDVNALAGKRNYLYQATGRFFAGGAEGGYLPQMRFENFCENHGIVADALIGAVTTVPYMLAASVKGVGILTVAAEAMNEMDDHVVMNGGDISSPDYVVSSLVFGGLYAYTERLQVERLLGGVNDLKMREALLKGFIRGIGSRTGARNIAVGTLSESVQEGLQNGIMGANEALALDMDATRAFADGFVQDFVGSLGTMSLVEAGGLAYGHWRRSGYSNPFSAAGREAGREARSTDLEAAYGKFMCQDRMVEYAARSELARMIAGASDAYRLAKTWEEGGVDALVRAGVGEAEAAEFDYFYRTAKEEVKRDEETGEEALDIRFEKARIAIERYISDKASEATKRGEDKDRAAFDAAMTNMDWVRSAWSQGAGVYRKDADGKVQDPGAKALEKLGFSKDASERLSRYFHYERAAAYSPAALEGIKARYETRMAGKVTAKAALARQFGGSLVRFDGADYLTFTGKDGSVSMVRVDETPGGVDFAQDSEGLAVSVERATGGKVTKEQWLSMSAAERERTWNEHGLVNEGAFAPTPSVKVTLPADPSAGIDSTQAAQIVGTISLDANTVANAINDTSSAFHETYHAFSNFAQASGLWTKEDVAYLERTFGKARHSRETHDEEAGAEGFRSFLARRAAGAMTADDEHSPYMKIYAAAAGLDRMAKEKDALEKIAARNETAFFHQLIAEANRPKPKPAEKPDLPSAKTPLKTDANGQPERDKTGNATETDQPAQAAQPVREPQAARASAPQQPTATWSAYTPTGNVKVSGHWAVLDLSDVVHSNNPLYAVHMRNQLRNRKDNKAEEDTRKDIVNNFQPERLMDAPDTANGAPIVFYDDDGQGVKRAFVLSGNGRVLVLNELAERHLYDRYRNAMKQWAADRGIFVPEGQTPVLVRVIDDYGGATRDKVADLSNTNSIQQYTEEEQARADAEVIKSLGIARLYKANADGSADMTPGANDAFFSDFIRGVGDTSLYNSDRSVTQAARDRARRALLAIAAGQGDRGREVVKKLVEQTETLGIQRQKNAVMMMAAPVAALESNATYAIGPDVSRAIADFMDYAEKHKTGKFSDFSQYLAQMDLLDAPSAIAKEILALLGSDKQAANIAEYVKAYCKAAAMEDPSGGLFGKARTREEIWNDAKKLVESTSPTTQGRTEQAEQKTRKEPEPPVLSVETRPKPSAPAAPPRGTDAHTVRTKNGEMTAEIPSDPARDGLRGAYDPTVETPESPDPMRSIFKGVTKRQNDPHGRYWGDKMPQFMGHKTEMFDRTVMTLLQKMTPEERAKFDTVVDYFGGGGCWGMSLALAALPNAKRLVINEFDPGRAKKIELLQTRGEKIADEVQRMFDDNGFMKEVKRIAETAAEDGGETGSGSTIANIILRNIKPKLAGDVEKLGLMYAFTDCASRQLSGSRDVKDPKTGEVKKVKIPFSERWEKVKEQLARDGKNATAMRKAFEERGGKVEYVNGDSTKPDFGAGFATPHGGNVMAVADPPYYRTEGYSDDGSKWKVGLESTGAGYAYADTLKLIGRLVDSGDGLVYTDEAWWLKPEYLETHRVNKDGLFDDSSVIAASREFRREHEILGGIRNMLDHFDVAGKVAGRYETLGVHHGGKASEQRNQNDGETGFNERRDDPGVAHVGNDADEQGAEDDREGTVQGLAGGAEGKDQPGLRGGGDSGQRSGVRTEDVVRDVYASVEDATADAKTGAINRSALEDIVRRSVRQVREDRQIAYADHVSENAKRWLAKAQKDLEAHMAAHGYTEKVWHGTEGDDFNVFRFSSGSHGVRAAYFTYRRETAQNYAALRSMDVEDLDNAKPNVRQFYVNPGRVLDIDESKPGQATTFEEFKAIVKKAYEDGYDSIRVRNAYDDQGFRFDGDETLDNMTYPTDEHDVKTDILIVFDRDGNPGANRIKAADPVTFMDDTDGELPIPIGMRAVRYSVGSMKFDEATKIQLDGKGRYQFKHSRGDAYAGLFDKRIVMKKAMEGQKPNQGGDNASYHNTENYTPYGIGKSTALETQTVRDPENDDFRFSVRSAWRSDFPKAVAHTTRKSIMEKYGDLFRKAKAGDQDAAADLIEKVVKPEKIRAIVAEHPNASIVVPVYAEEASGRNQLPRQFANYISALTGIEADDEIIQSVRAFHTGSKADHRLFAQPEFDGQVKRGAEYIIVDDHITQGGTVNALRDHIESNGGKVVAVSALTLSQGSSILSPRKETIDETRRKWPDIDRLLQQGGIADRADALTESQLRYINQFSPDGFRARIAQAVEQGIARVRNETLGTPSEGVARDETQAEREAMRHSVFAGERLASPKNVGRLADAKRMLAEANGKYGERERKSIYDATGWWMGTDGKWRVELGKLKARNTNDIESLDLDDAWRFRKRLGIDEYAAYRLDDLVTLPSELDSLGSIIVFVVEEDDLDRTCGKDTNAATLVTFEPGRFGIDAKIDILIRNVETRERNGRAYIPEATIKSLTHELQHVVQLEEGFAFGGNAIGGNASKYAVAAGEVEARNAARRRDNGLRAIPPWETEDVPAARQAVGYSGWIHTDEGWKNMAEGTRLSPSNVAADRLAGEVVARPSGERRTDRTTRRSVGANPRRRDDVETDARRAITAYAQAEGNKAANDALENYVAYFKLSHGSIPRATTLARIGLSLGMNVVDPKRILANADKIAEKMRGTLVEQASKNGDVATAMSLIKREKDAAKRFDELIAGGVSAGGSLTHKGVGMINSLVQRRVDSMMRDFSAATLADMEGDTGIDLAAEIIANNPDAFDVEYRRAKGARDEGDASGDASAPDASSPRGDARPGELTDAEKHRREMMLKTQAARVAKFIEDAKARAEDNKRKAEERRRRAMEIGAAGQTGGNPSEDPGRDAGQQNGTPVAPAKANFKTPGEFAAFLRVWAADRFMRLHGHSTLAQAQKDRLFAEFYRICVRQELQDLADKLLAPKMINADGEEVTNQRLARLGNGARVWASRRIADMEKGILPDTIERMSADVFAFINKAAVRVSRTDLITSFKDELKRRYLDNPEFDEFKEDTERKLTGWVEEATRYIAHVCDLSRKSVNGDLSQLEEEYRRLHEIIDARARVYDESGADAAEAAKEDAETRKAQWKLALLDKYGAMRSMMPGEILDLQNAAFDYLENEAKKLEDAWKETRKRQEAVRRDFAGAIVGPGDQRYDSGKGLFGWLDKTLLDSLNGLLRLRLEHLTRFAPDALKEKAKDAINAITVMLGEGEVEYAKALQADREAFFAGLGKIFKKPDGKADNRAIKRYLERMDEPIPTELAKKLSNQGFANSMTYGQMLQLLVSLEQRSFKDTVEANGREGHAELIRSFRFRNDRGEAVNAFTREDEAFVQWLRAFYSAKRERLSEVTERMVGQKVNSPDPLYCPIRRWMDDKAMTLHFDPTQRWDPISKIFSRRVPSTRDFDESRTIVGLFFENSKESAKLTAWAERGSFIRNVVTSAPFQASVKRAFGAGELGKILKQLEATFNGGEQRSQTPGEVAAADKAVNFVTYAYLGFNPLSALKQTTSFAVWANQLPNGFADLWRHMTHVDMKAIRHLMESDEYKVRYGDKVGSGMDYATKGLNMNPSDNPVMSAIRGAGMWMLKRGDFVPGAWIAQGVYKDLLDKHTKAGMNFAEADRLAIVETFNMLEEGQQSGRTYNTNMLQIEHGRLGRLLTQFATSPLQQLQYETQALREWRDMVRYQMGSEKIDEARAKFIRAVVINHVILPAAMNLVIAMYKAALGEEPPWEEDGYHWTLLIDLLLGQFSRVFFLGAFAQTTLEALLKRKYPRAGQLLPIEGAIGIGASGAFLLRDLATMDVDRLQKDIERAMKSTAPTRIPYNLTRRFLGDSDVDRKRRERERLR